MTRDTDLADDLAQDCFVHAWDKLHTYAGRGSFIGWLLKVAYTTFLQSRRRSSRYEQILQAAGHETETETERHTGAADEIGDLDKLLAVLTEQERAMMILAYACGLSHREIGDVAKLPVGTVKSIIFRSKDKIRERFEIENHRYG